MTVEQSAPHYELRVPQSRTEWDAYHSIRQETLFEPYHPDVAYVRDHADETKPGNHPLALFADDELVGTIRIDLLDEMRAALRLVAIHTERQGQGLGAVMLGLAEDFIRGHGRSSIVVHGNPPAVGFYLANGYVERPWVDDPQMGQSIDVAKDL
jgi:GNAT superfamily N-acetyltransferase